MGLTELGRSATGHGWRSRLADAAVPPVSRRTPWSEEALRTALGLVWLVLSLRFVVRSLRALLR